MAGDATRFGTGMSMTDALHQRKAAVNPGASRVIEKADVATEDWTIGDTAVHRKWGEGIVLAVTGTGKNMELKIKFPEVGMKRLLAAMAPIEKKE